MLLTPLPATGTALSSLSRTTTSPGDRSSLEKEQPGSGRCWHAGLSWLAAGRRSRVPWSRALKFVDVFRKTLPEEVVQQESGSATSSRS